MNILKACLMTVTTTIVIGTGLAGASSDVVTLKVAHFLPPSSTFHQKNLTPWCDKINKESNGRLKCQIYPSMQLGGIPSQLLDQARDGVADIVWAVPTYQAGRFTKSEVFELPFMVNKSGTGSQAMWDYVQKNSLDEFKGVKLIFTHLNDGSQMHFGKKSVKTLEDMRGLKLRAPTRLGSKIIVALGAIPVQMPATAAPEAISKGVVDGISISWEVMTSLKLQEVCKTHTEVEQNQKKHSNGIFVFAINQAKYNSLPADLKKVIDQNSGREVSKWVGSVWDSGVDAARKIAADRHNTFNVLSSDEYSRWVKATDPVVEGWIKDVNAKGGNGQALLQDAKALIKKYND